MNLITRMIIIGIFLGFLSCKQTSQKNKNTENRETKETNSDPKNNKSETFNIWDSVDLQVNRLSKDCSKFSSIDSLRSDFIIFYDQFISDSIFQVSCINENTISVIGECDTTIILNRSNWEMISWDFRDDFYNSDYENLLFINDSKVLFRAIRKEIGDIVKLGFEKIDGKWMLVLYDLNVC